MSRQRVCFVEWYYREEEFGAPMAHRLKPAAIEKAVKQAGFAMLEKVDLKNVVFYRLEK